MIFLFNDDRSSDPSLTCSMFAVGDGRTDGESESSGESIPNAQGHRGLVHPAPGDKELFVDVGAYGNPTVKSFKAKETCQRLEKYVRQVCGYQMMYADSYMTK
jgi:hypothetical protein